MAERILKGDTCDVFAPSAPAVIDQDLMGKKISGSDRDAASWYVVFSANEMVVCPSVGVRAGPTTRRCAAVRLRSALD